MQLKRRLMGKRITDARKEKGLSQATLADIIGKDPSFVSYIETGAKGMSLETFVEITNVLQVSPATLLLDQLSFNISPASREISTLLMDCTDYEVYVLLDVVRDLKDILRKHESVRRKRPSHNSNLGW